MLISRSLSRKLLATVLVVTGFVWLYEAEMLDSRFATRPAANPGSPRPGAKLKFGATAYCKGTTTASGVNVRSGIAASDPELLPVGSVIQVDAPGARHDGIYTIMDTGPKVKGRRLDLYMWSCYEALDFGYHRVDVTLLRLGWSPQTSEPSLIGRLFHRREAARRTRLADEPSGPVPPSTLPGPGEKGADGTVQGSAAAAKPTDPSPDDATPSPQVGTR
jgi:3D (Asp-Asp-Asp) domain-containing protein